MTIKQSPFLGFERVEEVFPVGNWCGWYAELASLCLNSIWRPQCKNQVCSKYWFWVNWEISFFFNFSNFLNFYHRYYYDISIWVKFNGALTGCTSRFCKLMHTDEDILYTLFCWIWYTLWWNIEIRKIQLSRHTLLFYATYPSHYDKTSINNNVCDDTSLLISTNVTLARRKY